MKAHVRYAFTAILSAWCSAAICAGDLTVDGVVESKGGFRFPDGSVQTTAAVESGYESVVVVAKSGGDFTSVQAAIDSITDASSAKRYLVWVAPGNYEGAIVLKPYVYLKGAGRRSTTIVHSTDSGGDAVQVRDRSEISSISILCTSTLPTSSACVGLRVSDASNSARFRDLEITSTAVAGGTAIGLAADHKTSVTHAYLENVSITAQSGALNTALLVQGRSWVNVFGSHMLAKSAHVSDTQNRAVRLEGGGTLIAYDSRVEARGGDDSKAVSLFSGVGNLNYTTVSCESYAPRATCIGIDSNNDSSVNLEHSSITIDNAARQYGILAQGTGTKMTMNFAHSKIRAEDYTAFNAPDFLDAVFLFTHFHGGIVLETGNTECRYSTDETFNTFVSGCP